MAHFNMVFSLVELILGNGSQYVICHLYFYSSHSLKFLLTNSAILEDGGLNIIFSFQLISNLLDIVQSFPLLSYCIVGPMSVYIYKSNM